MFQVKNVMEMRKMILFVIGSVLLMVGTGLVFSACSSDDGGEVIPVPDPQPVNTDSVTFEPEVVVELDTDTIQTIDSLNVVFQLLNGNNQAVKSFKEGENIVFRLKIANTRGKKVYIHEERDLIGENAFELFGADGESLGLPWDLAASSAETFTVLEPNEYFEILCTAFGDVEVENDSIPFWLLAYPSRVYFGRQRVHPPLAKGNYYTQFEINLNEVDPIYHETEIDEKGVVLCRKDFTVE